MLAVKPWMAVEPAPTSHWLAGLPGLRFSTTTGVSAARAGPPGANVPRRAAARAAAGATRHAPRANEDRLAVIAATFVPSRTTRSPPGRHARRRGRSRQRGPARPRGGAELLRQPAAGPGESA